MLIKQKQRVALSIYFFLMGMSFASFTSRIPTIKDFFHLSEDDLGNLLMILPASAIIGIPLSGWVISKYDSRYPQQISFIALLISIFLIGVAPSLLFLGLALILFAVSLRVLNISINTQSLTLQNKFKRKIVGSFHALWSLGGVCGVLITTLMLRYDISITIHLIIITLTTLIIILITYPYLLKNDKVKSRTKFRLEKPNRYILLLGLMVFFAAVCEGGMYDWNGVYFKEVVNEDVFTYGYLGFMICMTFSRFSMDELMNRFNMQKLYIACSILIILGTSIAIFFPSFWVVFIGFCLLGIGISGLFPMTFILAGKAEKYPTGIVMSIIGTYSTVGMFLGPPLIGYLAEAFGLQKAFIVFIIGGFMFVPLSNLVFNHIRKFKR